MFHVRRRIACFDYVSRRSLSVISAWRHRSVLAPSLEGSCFRRTHPRRRQALAYKNSSGRNGLLYIPTDHAEPLPLLILLHKAGGSPSEWFSGSESYAPYADKGHFIILAPESPGQSWGTGPKEWGYDYVAINRALEEAFARCAIDRSRLAIGGFSDGALVRAFTWPGQWRRIQLHHRIFPGLYR